jgi:predicted alpha/beta-fold hydrolase
MPFFELKQEYKPNWYSNNKHAATILPSIFRKIEGVNYQRERIILKDKDFLDLDWVKSSFDKLLIITHGLEGNSSKQYVKGLALHFNLAGWDILAWNCRSCSGEMNNAPKLYHHGDTKDIGEVVDHVMTNCNYTKIAFAGHSMGGVINSKYLSELSDSNNHLFCFNLAISTPCDLEACALTLDLKKNLIYKRKFQKNLTIKILNKEAQFPGIVDVESLKKIKTWREFDNKISAPFNGFESSKQLYKNATINNFVNDIKIPTLILNSLDDPLIPKSSNPVNFSNTSSLVTLAVTNKGGHCGFTQKNNLISFSELYTLEYATQIIK